MSNHSLSDILFSGPEHQPFVMAPQGGEQKGSVLLLHGFPGTPAEMRPLGEQLANAGWLTYGPLLPGFGAEIANLGKTDRHRWVQAAWDAGAVLRERGRPLVLCGYSMGAAVALNAAAAIRPDLLLLFAPFWRMGDWRADLIALLKYVQPEIAPLARADLGDPRLRHFLHEMAPTLELDNPEVRQLLKAELVLPTAIIGELLHLGREAYRFAARVKVPTLIVQSCNDDIVTPAATRALLQQLGGKVTYYEIPGDHTWFKELDGQTTSGVPALILTFLQRNLEL